MVPEAIQAAETARALKDSRFHNNNTSRSIKALQEWREKEIITREDALPVHTASVFHKKMPVER